ncbi:PriCT-2 domain-containing protein, partial [Vibrio parahaemolyticus]
MVVTNVAPAELPAWVLELLEKPNTKPNGLGRGSEEMSDEDIEDKYTPRQVKKMLDFIDPDELDYEEWLICLQAVHSQHPNHEGFELADRWSQRGSRYQEGEVAVRWKSFNEAGEIRIGSLIH